MAKPKRKKKENESASPPPVVSDSSFRRALISNSNSSSSGSGTNSKSTSCSPSSVTGRIIREMASDGNCMFRALSDQLHRDWGEGHSQVRQDVCNFLLKHSEDFAHFLLLDEHKVSNSKRNDKDICDIKEYVLKMSQDGEWGGQVELVCAARLYRRKITVFSPVGAYTIDHRFEYEFESTQNTHYNQKTKNSPLPPSSSLSSSSTHTDLLLSYHENNHYNSVFNSDTLDELHTKQKIHHHSVLLHPDQDDAVEVIWSPQKHSIETTSAPSPRNNKTLTSDFS